jgi:hypothetical protein
MKITMLADRFGYQSAVREVREEWLEELLIFLGVNVQEIHEMDDSSFFNYLVENKVDLVSYPSIGALHVEYDDDIVGEWAGPELTLKTDKETGELYYEVKIEYWSIVEEDIDLSS